MARWYAIRMSGRGISPRPSICTPVPAMWCSPRIIGPPGAPNVLWNTLPCSAICMPICTIRRCVCSTRDWWVRRSPKICNCRRRSPALGTRAATTVRSATTSRRSISATWAGSTVTPRTSGNIRPWRTRGDMWNSWAALRRCCVRRVSPLSRATIDGWPRCSTT
ncbi:Uncharacterised protein [Mycobacteroides abscessus subsp. abscessus]|nr:Uncharacterised protein [Mycobacteroides abscessus subsp. abscessus]